MIHSGRSTHECKSVRQSAPIRWGYHQDRHLSCLQSVCSKHPDRIPILLQNHWLIWFIHKVVGKTIWMLTGPPSTDDQSISTGGKYSNYAGNKSKARRTRTASSCYAQQDSDCQTKAGQALRSHPDPFMGHSIETQRRLAHRFKTVTSMPLSQTQWQQNSTPQTCQHASWRLYSYNTGRLDVWYRLEQGNNHHISVTTDV